MPCSESTEGYRANLVWFLLAASAAAAQTKIFVNYDKSHADRRTIPRTADMQDRPSVCDTATRTKVLHSKSDDSAGEVNKALYHEYDFETIYCPTTPRRKR